MPYVSGGFVVFLLIVLRRQFLGRPVRVGETCSDSAALTAFHAREVRMASPVCSQKLRAARQPQFAGPRTAPLGREGPRPIIWCEVGLDRRTPNFASAQFFTAARASPSDVSRRDLAIRPGGRQGSAGAASGDRPRASDAQENG